MRAVLTPDDLKKGDVVKENGWNPVELVEYKEEEAGDDAKNPGSTNCLFIWKIIDGPNKGLQATARYNETAMGFGKALWAVMFGKPDPAKGYTGDQLNTENFKKFAESKFKCSAYIAVGTSNKNNKFNEVKDYKPL